MDNSSLIVIRTQKIMQTRKVIDLFATLVARIGIGIDRLTMRNGILMIVLRMSNKLSKSECRELQETQTR